MSVQSIPKAFIWRRLHSLTGLWLVLFLIEHLLVNSQAALLLGDNARGFVEMVNSIHNLPYLQVIEIFLLGAPILLHGVWGIRILFQAKFNSAVKENGRNRAFTWQRLTSWILLVGIVLHVIKFRFIDYPDSLNQGERSSYFVTVSVDQGLYTVASRLGVELYGPEQIEQEKKDLEKRQGEQALVAVSKTLPETGSFDAQQQMILTSAQTYEQKIDWIEMLEKRQIQSNEVVAVAKDFGTASLLTVRDTFKSPLYVALYTIFVLAACFHGINGLWTFCITWGVIIKVAAQQRVLRWAWGLMALIAFLGLASIWGTYWFNLKL